MTQEQWDLIEEEISPFLTGSRTPSIALLAWFLHNVWRLDLPDVDDAVCDGSNDKGIDALVVDDDLQEITLFQSKHRRNAEQTQGDRDLEQLVGAGAYFESPEAVDALLASGPNLELRRLIRRTDVRNKVANGSHVSRVVFLTNGVADDNARGFARAAEQRPVSLELWDAPELATLAERTRRPELRPETVTMTSVAPATAVDLDGTVRIAIAVVPATELLQLPGIADRTLFARNVRLGVGATRVNRELATTVLDAAEHPLFPAYHNGMTILTRGLTTAGNELVLDGVTVVNGCQSLLALEANRAHVTEALRLLVKIVQVDPQSGLADAITYRTNNQNSVDIRDQRSTDLIQRDLQAHVAASYGDRLAYAIRAGEPATAPETLDNATAAQLLMAVYVEEPWNAVRKVRLFDQDYHRIFHRSVTAHRLFLLHELRKLVDAARATLVPELQASFASVRFTLAYLVARVLQESHDGRMLLERPERWLPDRLSEVQAEIRVLVDDVVGSVNFYVEDRSSPPDDEDAEDDRELFDPKTAFKSVHGVRALEAEVLRSSRRQARRDPTFLFSVPAAR